MKIKIKNMVCRHCVAKVAEIASSIPGLNLTGVEIGSINLSNLPAEADLDSLDNALKKEGFEIIHNREDSVVSDIKSVLIDLSRSADGIKPDIDRILSDRLNTSYRTLSRIFATVEGRTIESYFSALRIERVKELILDGQQSLAEIAFSTGFSSVPHLSSRFKQMTGMTPTQFRSLGKRTSLDLI